MLEWLKKLSPTHEPITYLALILVAYQLFVAKQPLDDYWIQYVAELVLGGGARQLVKPLAKIKAETNG